MSEPAKPPNRYPHPPVRPDWLQRWTERALDPALPIVDPHHRLWDRPRVPYTIVDLADDIGAVADGGHNAAIHPPTKVTGWIASSRRSSQ